MSDKSVNEFIEDFNKSNDLIYYYILYRVVLDSVMF